MQNAYGFRRGLALLLSALLLAGLLAGCGGSGKPAEEPAAKPALPSDEAQRQVIEANRELWAFTDPYDSPWFYTIADLDHNGLLEILAATTQGTGIFTYAHYYEVLADGSGLKNLYHDGMEIEGPDDWPEVIRDQLDFYYDPADDSYHYLCEGVTREGAAHQYFAWYALCLQNGVAEWELLASKDVEWLDGGETENVTCKDAQGNPITEQEYDEAAAERFAGLEKRTAALFWTQEEIPFEDAGSALFDEEPTPAEEPAETETPYAPVGNPTFHITKNPTSESLSVGGKTWFIAHADNGVAPVWQMLDPWGEVYTLSAAMDSNPGLQLEVLPKDTLAVSNVPLSVNGWSVVARFDGDGGSLTTEPAFLYVGDFVSAYGSVIQKYRDAVSRGGEIDLGYVYENGLAEGVKDCEHVGYALKDLDKNGIPELIIADLFAGNYDNPIIFDICTLSNGVPKSLAQSWARNRYYLRTDSLIVNEGSGGAAFSEVYLFAVGADGLTPKEGIITFFPGDDRDSCYHQVGHCDYEPQPDDTKISLEEYSTIWDSWKSLCYIPPLTQIA